MAASTSRKSFKTYLEFVKFEHTLFALPFAYGGMLLAADGWPGWTTFFWITLAMIGARTASMALNRVTDAAIDAHNPRTANREIPRGALSRRDGILLALLSFVLLAVAGWALNPLTLALLPVAVFFLSFYSFTKRFTWLCHYVLGLTIGAAAAGGWIAVTGSFAPATIALWAGVGLWIAGFDIIYALLDYDFDVKHGIYSVPSRFGKERALYISAITHLLAWFALGAVLPLAGLSYFYALAMLVVAGVLIYAHLLVRDKGVGAALASFNANLYVSSIVLLGVVLELIF
ncbi:MAG: UbiA-like polyprenyltransferase [Trueperaceae bacterium]